MAKVDKMYEPKFVISATEAASMAQNLNLPSVQDLLPALVQPAQTLARPPISNYHVGAVGLGSDGRVFVGVNLEFPNLPLHHSVHAEQFLVTNLAVHGCTRLLSFAVSAAPCGHCRQFLQELRNPGGLMIRIMDQVGGGFRPLSEILPDPFGPFDLLGDEMPLLLEKHHNGLVLEKIQSNGCGNCENLSNGFCEKIENKHTLLSDSFHAPASGHHAPKKDTHAPCEGCLSENLSNGFVQGIENNNTLLRNGVLDAASDSHAPVDGSHAPFEGDRSENLSNGLCVEIENKIGLLRAAALEAANESHAPYSACPSGVVLMDSEGKIYKGSYAESAAYNPSLGPVQAALVAYIAGGGGGYEGIVAAVLVEKGGAKVRQEDTARLLLNMVSPKCDFRVFHCYVAEK